MPPKKGRRGRPMTNRSMDNNLPPDVAAMAAAMQAMQ